MRRFALAAAIVAVILAAAWAHLLPVKRPGGEPEASLSLDELLGSPQPGFARPETDWELRLPEDHAAHPEFHTEAWSVHGRLEDEDGNRYGFQLAFFRLAVKPEAPRRDSAWAANQIYRAHLTLTDGGEGAFSAFERFSREALGLAGSSQAPPKVWLEDWSLEAVGREAFRLEAAQDGAGLKLELKAVKGAIQQGDADLLDRSMRVSAGVRYYLLPRLAVAGMLRSPDKEVPVSGLAWLDRVWGEPPAAGGQLALNRFELQLDDGRDLLCLDLRRREGGGTPIPSCLLIGQDGSRVRFDRRSVRLEPDGYWTSPADATRYPVRWRISIPDMDLELSVRPLADDQELAFAMRAWSGAVTLSGSARGRPVTGEGHLDLSGYAPTAAGV